MKCREFQEQISAAVDRYLQSDEMSTFGEHANGCPACRGEYEMELRTKQIVCSRMRMIPTPSSVTGALLMRLNNERSAPSATRDFTLRRVMRSPFMKPALAFAATCAVVIFLVRQPPVPSTAVVTASLAGTDIVLQSLSNFQAVIGGAIKPQIISDVPESVQIYFSGKTEFPVLVPSMRHCTLVGGAVNECAGTVIAHVVYRREGKLIYMCQACLATVTKGDKLNIPDRAKSGLEQTGWFSETTQDGNTVILWKKGATLCAAVAQMSREDLLACLTEGEVQDRSFW